MTPYTRILLFANIAVYFLQNTVRGVTSALIFVPQLVLVRPWTIVTYMFLHAGLMHIAFNMLALFFFGPQVEARLGSRSFLRLYFISGITGAALSLVLGPAVPILGASAAVFGVMLAFAMFWPDAPIMIWGILPVPAKWLVIFTTLASLYFGFGGGAGGIAHFAHLGGYLGAWLYLKYLQRGRQAFRRKAVGGPPVRELTFSARPQVDLQKVHEVNRDEVNRILDKISAHGMSALTAEERLFLSNFAPPDDRVPPVS